jgi:hypothetical protein
VLERIEELRLVDEAVHNLLVLPLPLERPEQPVPDDEDPGVVLVQAVAVRAVVNAVVLGCVEDVLQGAQVLDHLGVDPELVEEVELSTIYYKPFYDRNLQMFVIN